MVKLGCFAIDADHPHQSVRKVERWDQVGYKAARPNFDIKCSVRVGSGMVAAQRAVQLDGNTHYSGVFGDRGAQALVDTGAGERSQNGVGLGRPPDGFGKFQRGERLVAVSQKNAKDRIDDAGMVGDIVLLLAAMHTQGVLHAVNPRYFGCNRVDPIDLALLTISLKDLAVVIAKMAL